MFEGFKVRKARAELEIVRCTQLKEALTSLGTDRLKKSLEDPDESNWTALGKPGDRALDIVDAQTLREQAAKMYYTNTHARNIIRLFEKYVVGRGFAVGHQADIEPLTEWWKDFWKINKMGRRCREIVRRGMRDGEVFLRKFYQPDTGMLLLRFMIPDLVKNPTTEPVDVKGDLTYGIETDKDDVENVLAYYYKGKRLNADEVLHAKILVDSDVKRGRSFLEVVARDLVLYRKWLTDRMKLNYIRSLIGLIRKVKGSATQAANLAAGYETDKVKAPDGTAYQKTPEGVSIITTNEGVDYEFKTPDLQAADVQHDGRAVLLSVSAGAGLPESMVTSDASNANYSSSLIAEAPGVMEFLDWQDFWREFFEDIYTCGINAGIKAGAIPEKYEKVERVIQINQETGEKENIEKPVIEDTPTECDITFPEIVHRELEKETRALVLQSQQGWISDHTASGRLNLTYEEEQEHRRQEEEDEREFGSEDTEEDAAFEKARQEEIDRETQTRQPENERQA